MKQGQLAGEYAQKLRGILRQMSKDDSKVQLKSLEQALLLGQNIAEQEQAAIKALRNKIVSPNNVLKSSRSQRSPQSPELSPFPRQPSPVHYRRKGNSVSRESQVNKPQTINRLSQDLNDGKRIPGLMPDGSRGRKRQTVSVWFIICCFKGMTIFLCIFRRLDTQ